MDRDRREGRIPVQQQEGFSVPALFETAVAATPGATAVVHGGTRVGYVELNERANRLARRLVSVGVGPDTLVAVAMPRSVDLVVALLAVLKAGGAYLPLDPSYPAERLSYMMLDARPVLLLRAEGVEVPDAEVPHVVYDAVALLGGPKGSEADLTQEERLAPLRPDHLLYVIYTSGSTGLPKGVALTSRGVADLLATQTERFGPKPGERVLQWASVSFDAAFWDLTMALFSGATLVMADADEILPGRQLNDLLTRYDITHAVLPPAVLSLTDSSVLKGGTIMSTGDAVTPALVREWSQGRRMFNGYGPTEVTVGASISGPGLDAEDITIGVPWTGGQLYVLDQLLRPVPDGQEGELYLAGSGLARCYLNRPGLSATRFVPDPFGPPGSRMYRSGDRGSRRADGEFQFAGRVDAQVKLRGFRVELGEVESRLSRHPAVDMAVVLVEGELADAMMVAYVTLQPGATATAADLRRHVADVLPPQMVPGAVVALDRFPLTSNGKVDRSALPGRLHQDAPEAASAEAAEDEGGSPVEAALCGLVQELLSLPRVTPQDNLFELGGNSLVAARLAIRLRGDLGVGVPMRAVLEARSLAELARAVEKEQAGDGLGRPESAGERSR